MFLVACSLSRPEHRYGSGSAGSGEVGEASSVVLSGERRGGQPWGDAHCLDYGGRKAQQPVGQSVADGGKVVPLLRGKQALALVPGGMPGDFARTGDPRVRR
jgi:hypothetical protein